MVASIMMLLEYKIIVVAFFTMSFTKSFYSSANLVGQHKWSHGGNEFVTIRGKDGTIIVSPAPINDVAMSTAAIFFCHGLGDSAEGWVDVAEQLITAIPYVKFILPTAPTQPVTINRGEPMSSWYDIVGFADKWKEECDGILQSRDLIRASLTTEHESNGIPYSRMVLAGHSQGASLSLFAGLSQNPLSQKLAGILIMSGYLASGKFKFRLTPGLEDTPILHCHGTQDDVVLFEMAKTSKEFLVLKYGTQNYTLKSYPMKHNIIEEELQDAMSFLRDILPQIDDDRGMCIASNTNSDSSL